MLSKDTEPVVYDMLARNASFSDIEEFIDSLDVDAEEKSVLWLLAWSEQPRPVRRYILRATG